MAPSNCVEAIAQAPRRTIKSSLQNNIGRTLWAERHADFVEQVPDHRDETQSAGVPKVPPDVALFEPGNEEFCRKLLDQAVAADDRTFTQGDHGGPLIVLRVPDEETLPSDTKWGGDLPGTTLATPADVVERAQRVPWYRRGKGKGLVRIHAPRQFASDYLTQMRGRYGAAVLTGISRVPDIEDDGTVQFLLGHDRRSGLYYDRPAAGEVRSNERSLRTSGGCPQTG